MITPGIIQIIFWIGVLAIVVIGIAIIATAEDDHGDTDGGVVAMGIMYIIFGPIVWRIYCELAMVFFRMYDALKDILKTLQNSSKPLAGSYCQDCGSPNRPGDRFCNGCGKTLS